MTDASITKPKRRGTLAALVGFLSAALNALAGLMLATVALASVVDMARVIGFHLSPWFKTDTPGAHAFFFFIACAFLFQSWVNEERKRQAAERLRSFQRKEIAAVVREIVNSMRARGRLN